MKTVTTVLSPQVYLNGKRLDCVAEVVLEERARHRVAVKITTTRPSDKFVVRAPPSKSVPLRVRLGGSYKTWMVPRGFASQYRGLLAAGVGNLGADLVSDALALVGYAIDADTIRQRWDLKRRYDAYIWATRSHVRASDNRCEVPPRPPFLHKLTRAK